MKFENIRNTLINYGILKKRNGVHCLDDMWSSLVKITVDPDKIDLAEYQWSGYDSSDECAIYKEMYDHVQRIKDLNTIELKSIIKKNNFVKTMYES